MKRFAAEVLFLDLRPALENPRIGGTAVTEITIVAKAARAALRRAFPGSKISVTSSGSIVVRWADHGPSLEQVKETLLKAECAEAHAAYNGEQYLRAPSSLCSYWLDRYNVAERVAAEQQKHEQEQEYELRRQRENEAVAALARAKNDTVKPIEWQQSPPVKDPAAFDAFETLRRRAESDVTSDAERSRRPTWAPPMILGEELGEACYTLGYLTDDDKWIGRLWATFATPKRSGRYLREHISSLPLSGIECRGFQFHAGEVRGPTHAILFEAQRTATGEWQFGPRWSPSRYWSAKSLEWKHLVRRREGLQHVKYLSEEERKTQIEALSQKIDVIDAEDLVKAQAHRERQQLRGQVLDLARQRVLDFIGAPDAQMQLAGRLWGHCCICGKELTDPISLERGIGPECLKARIDGIKHLAKDGHRPESIAVIVGMPLGFVTEVLKEAAV
jgi:Family of unknown function (DUF6011)/Large polyvalent protein associated domain 29